MPVRLSEADRARCPVRTATPPCSRYTSSSRPPPSWAPSASSVSSRRARGRLSVQPRGAQGDRRAPGGRRRERVHADDAERRVPRSAASGPRPRRRYTGRERAAPDGPVRRDGVPPDLDLRALPAPRAARVRRSCRVGRSERDRVLQLRARRADEPLQRLHRRGHRDRRQGAVRELHRDEERRAQVVLRLDGVSSRLLAQAGSISPRAPARDRGRHVRRGDRRPASRDLEESAEGDRAGAASSGSVAMFHAVGVTPEAPALEAATGAEPATEIAVTGQRGPLATSS